MVSIGALASISTNCIGLETMLNLYTGCGMTAHNRCIQQICIVCCAAFHPDQVMAAFIRCFASLFYTYRKFLGPSTADQRKGGMLYGFKMDEFLRSVPQENAEYMTMLRDTQGQHFGRLITSLELVTNEYT